MQIELKDRHENLAPELFHRAWKGRENLFYCMSVYILQLQYWSLSSAKYPVIQLSSLNMKP
jgi:hypothetical protein